MPYKIFLIRNNGEIRLANPVNEDTGEALGYEFEHYSDAVQAIEGATHFQVTGYNAPASLLPKNGNQVVVLEVFE